MKSATSERAASNKLILELINTDLGCTKIKCLDHCIFQCAEKAIHLLFVY